MAEGRERSRRGVLVLVDLRGARSEHAGARPELSASARLARHHELLLDLLEASAHAIDQKQYSRNRD